MVGPDEIERFVRSMPRRYAQTFDAQTIEQHARTVHARGSRPVNVGLFTSQGRPDTPICVVAPDRSGLLALISLGFVARELEITAAEIFTRHSDERTPEAVDLFWVRRHALDDRSLLSSAEIRSLRAKLAELLQRAPQELLPVPTPGAEQRTLAGTLVRFVEGVDGQLVTLELETDDRSGLLLSLCQALFGEGIQIVGSRIQAINGRIKGRFELADEAHGPIPITRQRAIKLAVMTAIDGSAQETRAALAG